MGLNEQLRTPSREKFDKVTWFSIIMEAGRKLGGEGGETRKLGKSAWNTQR